MTALSSQVEPQIRASHEFRLRSLRAAQGDTVKGPALPTRGFRSQP